MKTFFKALFSFLLFFALSSFVAGLAQSAFGIPATFTVATLIAVTFFAGLYTFLTSAKDENIHTADVQVEFWVNYIIERLWKDNLFLKKAFNDDQYVIGGKIVHIPQPGAKPTVVKNRNTFPAAAVRRTDTDILYSLDEYSTDPTHIQDAEKVELSYEKIDSVLGDHLGTLNETVGDDMLIKWLNGLAAARRIATTGATSTANNIAGQTGGRKTFTHKDLRAVRKAMNLANVPGADRYVLLEENMMDELAESLSETQYKDFSKAYDPTTGVIGTLYGFDIMTRSSVAVASAAGGALAVNALGAAVGSSDNVVSIAWQKDAVTRALGEVKFFENTDDALYYGDVYSSLVRMGGRRRRADDLGVIAIEKVAGS